MVAKAAVEKLDALEALINSEALKHNTIAVGNAVYVNEAGALVLTLTEETAGQLAAVDVDRLSFAFNESEAVKIGPEDATYAVVNGVVVITLNAEKQVAVNAGIQAVKGIGNAWVHVGEGLLLNVS